MKKIIILLFLTMLTLQGGCQEEDHTFKVPIYVTKIIFSDGTSIETVPTGSVTLTWDSITGKPSFATVALTGDFEDLKNKPMTVMELQEAISSLPGIIPPRLTQSQIDTLILEEGKEVYNLTIHAKQYYNGTIWKTIITNQ